MDENLIWQLATDHDQLSQLKKVQLEDLDHMYLNFYQKNLLDKNLKFRSMIFPDKFIDQDKPDLMYKIAGLDSKSIEEKILDTLNSNIILQKQK